MTALVRQHETVMALCDTRFHAQPHPIKSVWRVPRRLPGTRRWEGSDTMPSLVPPVGDSVLPSSPPAPSSVCWFGCGAACRGTSFGAVRDFLSGWAGIFSPPWSLCAWHCGHTGTQPALGLPQPCFLLCRRPRLPKGHGHRVRSSPHSLGGASRSIEARGRLGAPPEEPGGREWLWAVFLESSGQQTSLFPFVLGLA